MMNPEDLYVIKPLSELHKQQKRSKGESSLNLLKHSLKLAHNGVKIRLGRDFPRWTVATLGSEKNQDVECFD